MNLVTSSISTEKLLKCEQVASILNISRSQTYKIVNEGHLPSIKIGKSVRVRASDLEKYLDICLSR
jgi:excisionase family DNA binding protein